MVVAGTTGGSKSFFCAGEEINEENPKYRINDLTEGDDYVIIFLWKYQKQAKAQDNSFACKGELLTPQNIMKQKHGGTPKIIAAANQSGILSLVII